MAENEFNKRPDTYSPMAGMGQPGDPMSLAMMMLMPQLLSGMAGPGKFLPSLSPSQGRMDGYMAYRYQQDTLANTFNAANQGNEQVSRQLGGFMKLMTGQNPSQMNKEQQDFFAGIVNNPIAKAFIGQAIGPENMEGILFGSRGDPSALAATVNRIGAFRRGPTGERDQMNAKQLQQFTQGLHQTLYGSGADVNDMHGLMAGQTGQLMENLFQRGALPRSIGTLTPAERAKMVSGQLDDTAIEQVSREFGRSELSKDKTFAAMTPEAQERELDKRMGDYRTRITDTMTKIKNIDTRTMGPEERDKALGEVERSEEYQALASRVDSKRVGETLKQYTGAVSAVREIFGDNGNPNAPMGALLAALEQLSSGAASQMKPQKVEATLREMRLAAKETGVGMEQMMGFAGQMSAMGDTLGIAKPLSLQNTRNALTMVAGMEATGAFEGNRFGSLTKSEAMQEVGARMQRGEASPVAKTMAAMARAVAENPDKYKGTEVEAMVSAYNNPASQGQYTFKGKSYNLYETAGRGGPQAVVSKFVAAGGNERTLEAYYYDKGTQEFQQAGAAFETQKFEMQRTMQLRMNNDIFGMANNAKFSDAARMAFGSRDDKEFAQSRDMFVQRVSADLTKQLATEGANLEQKDRPRFLQERANASISKALRQQNPALTQEQADKEAARLAPLMFGETYGDRRDSFARMASNVNAELEEMTNLGLTGNASIYNATPEANRRRMINENKAKRLAAANRGHESPMAARIGDALGELGAGKDLSVTDIIQRVTGVTDIEEMLKKYAPELAPALEKASRAKNEATADKTELQAIVSAAEKNPKDSDAINKLKRRALTDLDATYIGDDEIKKRLAARTEEDLQYQYDQLNGEGKSKGKSKDQLVQELSQTASGRSSALGKDERSRAELEQQIKDTQVVSNDDIKARLADTNKFNDETIASLYKQFGRGTAKNRDEQIYELSRSLDFHNRGGILGNNERSISQLGDQTLLGEGGAAGFTPEEIERNRRVMRQVENIQQGLLNGGDSTLVETGAADSLRMVLGNSVTPQMLEAMTQVTKGKKGTKEDEDNLAALKKSLEGRSEQEIAEVVRNAQAFRDAKEIQLPGKPVEGGTGDKKPGATPQQQPAPDSSKQKPEEKTPSTIGDWIGGFFDAVLGTGEDERKRQERAKSAQAASVAGGGTVPQTSAQQATKEQQTQTPPTPTKTAPDRIDVSGTLRVENLYEVFLATRGTLAQETPDGGAPVA